MTFRGRLEKAEAVGDGIRFTHCSATSAATDAQAAGRRRQVIINGRRVKTIDVHAHCVVEAALNLMGRKLADQRGPGLGEVGARRIAEMDEAGIDVEALSINPFWYKAERDLAAEVVKINNENPHSSAKHSGAGEAIQGQWLAGEHDRQPARYGDRAVASHLREHPRPVSRTQDLLGAWRRLPAVIRAALG
jgi:hypothetical protein